MEAQPSSGWFGPPVRFTADGGQQNADQNRDDADDDEQPGKRERAAASAGGSGRCETAIRFW
jgi:hypothetical protein